MYGLQATIDLDRLRKNAIDVTARAGVEVWATIKADAYGLGAARVARAIAGTVAGFCVFALDEALAIDLWRLTGKPAIALGPPIGRMGAGDWLAARVRPAVSTADEALQLAAARPILCVDTGMERFACPAEDIARALAAGGIDEAFTHATRAEHAAWLRALICGASPGRRVKLHAAASSLLDDPAARLDAVRPGLAILAGATRVTARLVEADKSCGPIGYAGWASETGRHGVILAGYGAGVRPGPCVVNGVRQRIPEVGMQTAYVTLGPADATGDEVTLLGDGLTESELAATWGVTPHQVLLSLAGQAERTYRGE